MATRRWWRRRRSVKSLKRSGGAAGVAARLAEASRVSIVPGYGMAVAQAQHAVGELADALGRRGTKVVFAVHPVAGRMPGHMSVLLREAGIADGALEGPEVANPRFAEADVALLIGANDVTNPAARGNPSGPLQATPTLEVDGARQVIVIKRSLTPGFSGVDNALFQRPTTQMLFGDAKVTVREIVEALERL